MIKLSKSNLKPYMQVIFLQTLCLAVGLWIHHRFVVSSAILETEENVWTGLSDWSQDWISEFRGLDINELSPDSPKFQQVSKQLETLSRPEEAAAFVADSNWRIVLPDAAASQQSSTAGARGEVVQWVSLLRSTDMLYESSIGTLETPQGTRLGLAYKLKNGDGYIVAYRPSELPPFKPGLLLGLMPTAALIAFLWTCGLQGIVAYLILSQIQNEGSRQRKKSEQNTLTRTKALLRTRDAIVFGLAKLAESRDPETGHHLERISLYSTRLASVLRKHPQFRDEITPTFMRLIGISSALHDIGKVGIKDAILLKPGKLTKEEFRGMQQHSNIGGECIRQIERRLAGSNFLEMAREIAFYHHERWDGTGYPYGISGDQIPLAARIVAIADVYDALSSKRVYKDAWTHEKCVETIGSEAGKHFDPSIVSVFLEIESQFRDIQEQFGDPTENESEGSLTQEARKQEKSLTPQQEETLLTILDTSEDMEQEEVLLETAN